MKMFNSAAAALLTTTALFSVSSIASAQDGYQEDEIIVTATRRAESIQDVPIAVTAIPKEAIEKQGVVNVQNLSIVAPSFASSQAQTNSGTVVLRIRGVGTTSNNTGFESAVGVFIDGAYQSRPGIALSEFVDVERVEVLRGPQGTLFGRNTSAGALNIVNARPNLSEAEGFINATYGNYDLANIQGMTNFVISEDKLAGRLTGAFRTRDGYLDVFNRDGNQLGDNNSVNQILLRGQLGFEADNGLKGRAIVDYSRSKGNCCGAVEVMRAGLQTAGLFGAVGLGPRGGMFAPNVATSTTDEAGAQAAVDDMFTSADRLSNNSSDQIGFTAELEYPISDNADLIYIGSYRQFEASEAYDSDFSALDIFNVVDGSITDIDTMTHEIRLQGSSYDDRLSWLVGGYFADEKIAENVNFELGEDYGELVGALFFAPTMGAFGANPLTVLSGGVDPAGTSISNIYAQDSTSWSLFTHNTFDVTDALSVTVGLRYSDESKDGSFGQDNVNNTLCPAILGSIGAGNVPGPLVNNVFGLGCFAFTAPADLPAAAVFPLPRTFDREYKDDELIYTGKLGYEFTPDISGYASFTHGYKAGGFNLDSTAAAGGADPSFLSETVDAYEIGLKSRLADGRITFNAAAFIQEFEDFQVLEFTGAQFTTFNVPKAETRGIELESVARVTDDFTVNAALTLLDAEYPDDCAGTQTSINVTSLCGSSLTNAPSTVAILGANYDIDLDGPLSMFLNAQGRYESDRRTSTQPVILATQAPNPFDIQDANIKINARIGLVDEDLDMAVEFWGANLTDERTRGVTFNTVLRGDSRSAFIQEPRTYGVTVRKGF